MLLGCYLADYVAYKLDILLNAYSTQATRLRGIGQLGELACYMFSPRLEGVPVQIVK